MHKLSHCISRGISHVRNHTIVDRFQSEWRSRLRAFRQKRWDALKKRKSSVLHEIVSGLWLRLYFDSELSRIIYIGTFERDEVQFVSRFLKPGDVFVDAGANIGLFTVIAASEVGVAGSVIAFEPSPITYQRLVDNVALNKLTNVTCVNSALSDSSRPLEMAISSDGYDAWNSLGSPTAGNVFEKQVVTCKVVDEYMAPDNLQGHIALMKIDVEGWETKVLEGGKDFFSRPDAPTLMVEFTEEASWGAGTSCQNLYKLLEEFGYTMYLYNGDQNYLKADPLRNEYPYLNLIATKKLREVNSRIKS